LLAAARSCERAAVFILSAGVPAAAKGSVPNLTSSKNSFTTEVRRVSQRKTLKSDEMLQEQDYTLQTPTGGFFACKHRRANTLRISAKLCCE
jgi:hypothetical protein